MEDELENSRQFKIMSKLTFVYAFFNPVLGIMNMYYAGSGDFKGSMIIAGSISLFTVILASIASLIFRRTLGKTFDGSYIKNVIILK